jgi:glycosyltransferase involved in cell wall biosynthesis
MIKYYSKELDIEFCGYVSENELSTLYSNASAFVHTSIVEGFGFPVLEAMHFGLPILCSAGTGTEEISKPYSITVDPFDGLSLMKGFNLLVTAEKHCKEDYSIKYSPRLMCEQLDRLLIAMEKR